MSESEICWHRGMVATELGKHSEAIEHHTKSMAVTERDAGRATFLGRVFLLDSLTTAKA
jgi:hypothetical protein